MLKHLPKQCNKINKTLMISYQFTPYSLSSKLAALWLFAWVSTYDVVAAVATKNKTINFSTSTTS